MQVQFTKTDLHGIHDDFKTSNSKSIWNPKAVVIQMPMNSTYIGD